MITKLNLNRANEVVISGVLRLQSPLIYDELFAGIRKRIESGTVLTLDIANVSFLNSSGITALARLIIGQEVRTSG
jgi:hypothetical protein